MPVLILLVSHFTLSICSNICFKFSALCSGLRKFFSWQVAANLTGFGCVLAFTWLLHYLPMSVAFPLTQGLAVLGVQLIAAQIFFKERITLIHGVGTGLILIGIILLVY